jgi:nucleotide-binding universal stress UspA family protein
MYLALVISEFFDNSNRHSTISRYQGESNAADDQHDPSHRDEAHVMTMWFDDHAAWSDPEDLVWEGEASPVHPYQRIMVVLNDTPALPGTVRHAIRLAILSDAEVNFLAVPIIPAVAALPDMLAVTDDLIDGLTRRSQSMLNWAADAATDAGVSCRTHLLWGPLPGIVLYLADTTRCDLIVMGAPARSGWRRLFQPCLTKRVTARARQPVLVIKEPGGSPSACPSRPSQGPHPGKLLRLHRTP